MLQMQNSPGVLPLITVIITTYNYANFLPKAINSVLNQSYKNLEIIVIDDGSTDHTAALVKEYAFVKYFHQTNKGLSAARNAGIKLCKGEYIVFLDADDWLETNALQLNFSVIKDKPNVAFVSGNYYLIYAENNQLEKVCATVQGNHYTRLLQSNYIGMHATVMYQRWVFNEFCFDETLKACEDYDLYLNIARKHPVIHHEAFIATYYFHRAGLSHNYKIMMDAIAAVMQKQATYITSNEEESAYKKGKEQWKDYFLLLQNNNGAGHTQQLLHANNQSNAFEFLC